VSVPAFEWIGHHILLRRVVFEGVVENVEPLRVGSGRGLALEAPTDLEVLKVRDPRSGQSVPVIPGSSWKGVFRSTAVAVLRTLGINVCDGVPRLSCEVEAKELKGLSVQEKLKYFIEGLPGTGRGLCLLCLVFGTASFTSHVAFHDSVPISSDFKLGYRTGVAIDRRTGGVRRGALYTVEYVEPGARFSFKLEAKNLPNYALGLLAQVIMDIDAGMVKVGGFKSRGFGGVRFNELKIRVLKPGDRVLEALDPIDSPVELTGDWRRDLEALREAFMNSLDRIRKVSESGWRWSVILSSSK
jgi:CRISPR-associated RAMP protein (TIGR02581 family)